MKGLLLGLLLGFQGEPDQVARLAGGVFALDATDEAAALAALERALALGPDRKEAFRAGLFLHLRLRDLERAEDFGARALAADPADAEARIWLGNVAFWKGDLEGAARRYEEARSLAANPAFAADAEAKIAQVREEAAYRARAGALARRAAAMGGASVLLLLGACGSLVLASRAGRRPSEQGLAR